MGAGARCMLYGNVNWCNEVLTSVQAFYDGRRLDVVPGTDEADEVLVQGSNVQSFSGSHLEREEER